jgi:hypothetical protein
MQRLEKLDVQMRAEPDQQISLTDPDSGTESLDVVADRGYFSGEEILACDMAGITVTLPKPLTSGNKLKGRFVKQDFRYVAQEDVYLCPAGEGSLTITPMRKTASGYDATGPMPIKPVE